MAAKRKFLRTPSASTAPFEEQDLRMFRRMTVLERMAKALELGRHGRAIQQLAKKARRANAAR